MTRHPDLSRLLGKGMKLIPGWPGYLASTNGFIWSLKGKRARRLRGGKIPAGYRQVGLSRGAIRSKLYVHRLVCLAFHGPPPGERYQVAHFDGVADNNVPGNLRWTTAAENHADKYRHGTMACGESHGRSKLTAEQVREIREIWPTWTGTQTELANCYDTSQKNISLIVREETWAHL